MYTIAETSRNESSNVGGESSAAVLVPGFEGPSEETSVDHTAPKEEPNHGVLPMSISIAHEEGSDENNNLTNSETFQVHSETGQDADETAKEDTPLDDHAESSSAVQEKIADIASPDIAQDRTRRDEGSRKAKEEAIENEVWKDFEIRMTMLQGELEDLGARVATRLEERQREVQQNDTQENENEDGIITEIDEEFRQEMDGLQDEVYALKVAFTLEFSEREFRELRSQEEEPDQDEIQEASTGAYTLQTSDASITDNDVEDRTGDAENGLEEMDFDSEDGLEGVEVGSEADVEKMYFNHEDDVEAQNGDETITEEEEAEDEDDEIKVTEKPFTQPSDEQMMGDTTPASSYEVPLETDPGDYAGSMTTTVEQESPADQIVPQNASADASNLCTLSDDDVDAYQKPQVSAEHSDSDRSRLNNRHDRMDDANSNRNPPEAHASNGLSGQQETSTDSKEAKSQEKAANKLEVTDQPREARTTSTSGAINASEETEGSESPAISGKVEAAGEAEVTGNTASPGGSNDSGPASTVLTSTIPANTNTIPTHNVVAGHGSQRRTRHHARKAQPKKYGVNADNGNKGGS